MSSTVIIRDTKGARVAVKETQLEQTLRRKVKELEEDLAAAEARLEKAYEPSGDTLPSELDLVTKVFPTLTPCEAQVLAALYYAKGNVVNKTAVNEAIKVTKTDSERADKIVDVWVCKIRAKLDKALGIKGIGRVYIETSWGRGYSLSEAGMAYLRAQDVGNTLKCPHCGEIIQ